MDDVSTESRELVDAIEAAASRHDMAKLLQRHTYDEVNAAWKHVSSCQRAALSFVRNFDATIAHDFDDLDAGQIFDS